MNSFIAPPGACYPALCGERVLLRPIDSADADDVIRWRSDPMVASQFFSERPPTREEHAAWLEAIRQRGDRHEYMIVTDSGTKPVGTIGLSHIQLDAKTAEYGILIGEPDYRGKGLAREASVLILQYAFDSLGLEQVYLNVFADNTVALLLYQSMGFQEDPGRRGKRSFHGAVRETAFMSLSLAEWRKYRESKYAIC